jgi:hypothetical protein
VLASAVGRPDRAAPGRPRRRRASPCLRPWADGLRSLALRAGAGPEAGRLAQRRAVQGSAAAGCSRAGAAQSGQGAPRRPASHPGRVDILSAVLTDGLSAVEVAPHPRAAGRPGDPKAPRRSPTASTRPTSFSPSWPTARHHDAGRAQARPGAFADCARPLDLLGDEIVATAIKRQHEPPRVVGDLLNAELNEKQARAPGPPHDPDRVGWRSTSSPSQSCPSPRSSTSSSSPTRRERALGPPPRPWWLPRATAQPSAGRWHRLGQNAPGCRHRACLHSQPHPKAPAPWGTRAVRVAASSMSSIWSTSSTPRHEPAVRAAPPITSAASTSSSSTSSVTYPSPRLVASCSST